VTEFAGALDDYPAWLTAHGRPGPARPAAAGRSGSADQRRERKRAEAEWRKAIQPLRQALDRAESALARLQAERDGVEAELAGNSLYQEAAKERLQRLLIHKAELDERLAAAEEDWLLAAEALEQATRGA
jgi:ATP-binding cassette subfamily F protein 3